mgnify:CR=1 FL=1
MKKVILAINNKKIIQKIKQNKEVEIINNVQYREGILEILDKEKNISNIYIEEKIPGIISIEKLIEKIKIINKKINIIIFLEKEELEKINKLKKLEIKNIYIKNKLIINEKKKINNNKLLKNKKTNNKLNNKIKDKKIINKKTKEKNIKNNKIIFIYGNKKTGKTTIANLILIYLLKLNKKILLININKKIENNYLKIFSNYNIKEEKKIKNKNNNKNKIYKFEIKINSNMTFLPIINQKIIYSEIKSFLLKCSKKYDYILVDSGNTGNYKIKQIIMQTSNVKIKVIDPNTLGIKDIEGNIETEKVEKQNNNISLHIIYNKYYFNSVSPLIFKNILKNFKNIHTIFYQKEFIKLSEKIQKSENIRLKNNIKKKLEKILEN